MKILEEKKEELLKIVREFKESYLSSEKGKEHLSNFKKEREEVKKIYEEILEKKSRRENITKDILDRLLPFKRKSVTPTVTGGIEAYYAKSGEKLTEDRKSKIAEEVFNLIDGLVKHPDNQNKQKKIIEKFVNSSYSRGFRSGVISSVLYHLEPKYLLINKKVVDTVKYISENFMDETIKLSSSLREYVDHNLRLKEFLDVLSKLIPEFKDFDVFNAFCHWMCEPELGGYIEKRKKSTKKTKKGSTKSFEIDKEKLKDIIENLKSRYESAWNSVKSDVEEIIYQIKNHLLNSEEITGDVTNKITNLLKALDKKLGGGVVILQGGIWPSNSKPVEIVKHELVRGSNGIIKSVEDITTLNEEIKDHLIDIWYKIKEEELFSNIGCSRISILLTLANPKVFMPAHKALFGNELMQEINVTEFWGTMEDYLEVAEAINDVMRELKISNALEVAFYLRKYEEELSKEDTDLEPIFKRIDTLLDYKGQVILYGPPGTGKTYIAQRYVENRLCDKSKKDNPKKKFVTFHPAFSYEDFIEGIKPVVSNNDRSNREGQVEFKIEDGIFKKICREAYNALLEAAGVNKEEGMWKEGSGLPDIKKALKKDDIERIKNKLREGDYPRFYLLIDEINRGDIPKIFGELITLLEKDKRLFAENEVTVTLPYSKQRFGVPPNLYIIGTMNTSDRGIALIDIALRRRFVFIELMPDYDVLEKEIVDRAKGLGDLEIIAKSAIEALKKLNEKIANTYDRDHQIGHSYYFELKNVLSSTSSGDIESIKKGFTRKLKEIWFFEILPLLREYFYDSPDKLKEVLAGNIDIPKCSEIAKSTENSEKENEIKSFIKCYNENERVEFYSFDEIDDESFAKILSNLAGGIV